MKRALWYVPAIVSILRRPKGILVVGCAILEKLVEKGKDKGIETVLTGGKELSQIDKFRQIFPPFCSSIFIQMEHNCQFVRNRILSMIRTRVYLSKQTHRWYLISNKLYIRKLLTDIWKSMELFRQRIPNRYIIRR